MVNFLVRRLFFYFTKKNYSRPVRFLLWAGIDVNVRDHEGTNALKVAATHGCFRLALLFLRSGAYVDASAVALAKFNGHRSLYQLFLERSGE